MGKESQSKLDNPFEPGEKLESDGTSLATEAQDPKANRDAAGAEQERRRSITIELPQVELVGDKPSGKPAEPAKPSDKPADKPAQPAEKPVNRNEMEKAADAIEEACNGGWTGAGTDKDTIYAILEGKTEAERKMIDQIFREKHGKKYGDKGDGSDWGLAEEFADEMSGADLDKAMNLLNKKDGKADDAGRIHTALVERDQTFEGRSDAVCEKDIRDTIATMNSKQIAELEREYPERYGKSLRDALISDPNLAQGTKDALDIYLKGTDKRTADDTLKLADIAIREKDVDMFQEAMRDASPEARKRFMDTDGEKRMKDAFSGIFSDADFYHAKEYAEKGSLSTATKIRDNTSWAGDNEKAIEQGIAEMTAEQRKAYLDGRNIANGKEAPGLSPEQKAEALKTYQEIHSALAGAGNENEVAKWEDQVAVKGGSLVTRLASHRGSIYDDSMHDVLSTIEDMPEADWKHLKTDPEYRKEVEGALATYLNEDEMKRARDLLDAKQKAESFQEATASARRPLLDAIADNVGIFNNKETHIYEVIEKMTPEEQRKYREDQQFRKQLDDAVANSLDEGAERDLAMGMLFKVANGEKPTRGIVEKLNEHAADINTDEAAVIRDLRKAFADDPTLRERIINPQTAEDRLMATKFDNALHQALDPSEYERYAKPLLETGHLSMAVQLELNKGVFDDDEQGVYKDVLALANDNNPLAQAERQKILTDKEYQDKVFSFTSDEERKVALYMLEQGKMQPEDVIRSHLLGAGTGETEVKEALAGLSQDQIKQLRQDYARKYGEDLTYSLLDEMGGQDGIDVTRATRAQPTTDREAYNLARDELYKRRDGIGKAWVDNVWDGSGYMTDDAANKFAAAMSRSSAEFRNLSPEQQKALTEQVQKNLDMFAESKGAAADMAVDAVIIAAAIVGAKFTGGVSLALLTKTALLGAAFKVAAKSTIMGADYDWASSQVVVDSLTGAVDAASLVVGPAQLAQVFKMGEKAAATATSKLLTEGGEQLLKSGAEKQIGTKMFELVASTISNGAEAVDDKAIKALAKELAKEGQEGALEVALKQNLKEAMEKEARSAIKRTTEEMALNMGAGAIGGGTSGGVRGVAEWDTSISLEENLKRVAESTAMGAGMGAGMAGTFSLAFKGLGKSWEAIRGAGKEAPPIHPDTDVVINGQLLSADQKVISFRADGSPATASESGAKLQVSLARDADGRMLMLDHSEAGTWVKRAGSDKFERIPLGEPVPVKPGDEVRLGSDTGPKLEMGTAKRPEGSLGRAGSDAATAKPGLPDNWPKNIADVNGEPPVPPGHIRLYRGVKPSESEFLKPLTEQEWARWDDLLEKRAQGGKYTPFEQAEYEDLYKRFRQGHKSYSDSKATALHYAGEDGKLLYVDVPAGEALAMRDGGTGYLIGGGDLARVPHEYHVKAREHFDSPTNPRQTAPKAGAPPGRAGSEAPAREAPTTGTARGAEAGTGNARVNARNTDGNVTSVTDARGSQTSFEYSADGSVNKITHSDGTVLTTTDGKNWKIKSGNEELSLTAEFHVGDDGTLWQKTPKGEIVGSHADGSRVVREVDGTARLYGADNKLNELVTPGGERTKIEYGMDGDIHQLRHHDGTIVRSEDGFNWKITEPEGQTYDWRGKIEIDGQGHLKRTMASADPDLGPPGRRSGTSEADHGFGRP